MLQPECLDASPNTADELLNDDRIILEIARNVAPEGVHVDIHTRARMNPSPEKIPLHVPLLVYLMVYRGESIPLNHMAANEILLRLEEAVQTQLGFPLAKPGRQVSKPLPYPLLEKLIRRHT